jgi:2-keto-4-pentenoate hydratase/2-oxohepta-3-ene-1,7-dioic acid hydratase in catechol pathway
VKLATFDEGGRQRIGVVDAEEIVDLGAVAPDLPVEMKAFLAAGAPALAQAAATAATGKGRLPLAKVALCAPVQEPQKFLGVGLNYAGHIGETGMQRPEFPTFFNKQSSCVAAPGADIELPPGGRYTDYEGELALVIGRRCRRVPKDRAREVIAGYTIVNDVSVRDWQRRAPTMTLGKSWDTHGPMGPWLVTTEELVDPHILELRTWVNGDLRQSASTKQLLFDCFDLIETLSTVCTLLPGDVISTGTPAGVGAAMTPPCFLEPGDVVRIEISGIGVLENRVVAAPSDGPVL